MLTQKTKTNFFRLKTVLAAALFLLIGNSNWGFGQISESFESGLPGTYNSTLSAVTLVSGSWEVKDVISGTNGVNSGTKTAQIKNVTDAQVITPSLVGGVGSVSFYVTASTSSGAYQVNVSTDNGVSWTPAIGSPYTIGTTKTLRTISVNNSLVNKIQIKRAGATIYIDDFSTTLFVPSCIAPTIQATAVTFASITENSMNLYWTSGNGSAGRIVVMKETTALSGTPTSGTNYTADATFGLGGTIATNEYVVYNGTGNSVSVTGLDCGKTYFVKVYEYNTTDLCYNTTSPATASATTSKTAAPIAPAFTQICGSTSFAIIPNTGTESTFWQTAAIGTSELDPANVTKIVSAITTLYLRTKSSTGCWSDAVAVTPSISLVPVLTAQPTDLTVIENQSATFSVTATNASGYQWQVSTDNGASWTNILGATSASFTIASVSMAMDDYKYRAIVKASAPCTDITSLDATLNVTTGPCFSMNGPAFPTKSGFTAAGDIDTGGSPTSTIRLASGGSSGSISTTATGVTAGYITVKFRAKAWNSAEKQVTVTVGGTSILVSNLPTSFGEITVNFPSVSANPTITFSTISDKRLHLGNVKVFCVPIPPCTSTATISSFIPTSGPTASLVTISGTGFTGATEVKFGGVNATSFTIINSTTIIAEVPTGIGANSLISVSDASSCETVSVGFFALINTLGSCSSFPNYTDLFISEIYDSNSENVWNIELYNPTPNAIILDNVYQIKRAGDISDPTNYSRTIDLTGTVPANSVFTISAGSSTQKCTGVSFNFNENGAGINDNDIIALFKSTVLVDVSQAPNEKGYSLLRNIGLGVVAPSATYIPGDWTVNLTESCANMGILTFPIPAIVIATQPADVNGCSLTMSINSSTPLVTYQWKFNNPATMTGWQNVNSTNILFATISGETSANLSITGDVSGMQDFQFYCEVSLTGCSVASNAAQFNTGSRPIYRSITNGNWSTVANWEMSTDYTTYVAACAYPRSVNSSQVIIKSGTTVILDLTGSNSVDIDKVTIENTGTLELSPNARLTIYDSTASGADLIVNGTLFDRTNASNGMVLTNSTTWELGANGTVIKSNDAPIDFYRTKYQGGMSNIPATANWIFRHNADGAPIVGTDGFFYPNLSFENNIAPSYAWDNPLTTAFNGSAGFATVLGNLNVGMTGSDPCSVSNINTNIQPMLILGNLNINTGSDLINNTPTEFGSGFELKGNLLVDGRLNILDGTLERVLRFTGLGNQTVSGVGIINLYKMTVNKPSGDVVLNRNLQAQNELVMTLGNVLTNVNILELGLSTTQKGTLNHTSGFVVGKMKRWFNGTNANDNATALFPMGFDDSGLKNRFARINFTSAPAAGGHLTVEYIPTAMGLAGIPIPAANTGGAGFDVVTTEDQGYWKIDNEVGKLIGAPYTIACTGEGYNTITNLNELTLLKRIGGGNWFCPATHLATTGTIAMPTVSRSGVTDWSNFGFGGSLVNPLPVTLTAFSVSCGQKNTEMDIRWATASEQNSSHFIVEKSRDLATWSTVSQVQAAGNSNQVINYASTDINASNGVFYYRLKQVDLNGEFEIYGPISVSCQNENNSMNVYPNPSQGNFTVEISWSKETTQAQLQIVDLTGKVLKEMDVNLNNGTTQIEFNEVNLQMGTYLIRVNGEQTESLKPIRLVIYK